VVIGTAVDMMAGFRASAERIAPMASGEQPEFAQRTMEDAARI